MSAASARPDLASRVFDASLATLKEWRDQTASAIAEFRRWALVNQLIDDQSAMRLAHLERRLSGERLTIAFVAEYSRGKSELINALFFSDLGARLLPAGAGRTTLCPTEIFHDPLRAPGIRLLPIETREDPKSLREFIAERDTWKEIPLDPTHPEKLAAAFEVLSESQTVSATEAANLGLPAEEGERIEIPRWRYALVNFPHRLLAMGLTILDTPGLNSLGTEPELTLNRVPDADAIVFMLAIDTGATRTDLELWKHHIGPINGLGYSRYVVLNKIDGLRDGLKSDEQVLGEIDKQVRATAEALGVDPIRVFPLSAKQGLVARIQGDRDALIKSRIYRLEQALAQGLVHTRRLDHATEVGAETRAMLSEARGLIASRRSFVEEQVAELGQLQGKNMKLVETLTRKASEERTRIEEARVGVMALRAVHHRHADEAAKLLSPNDARESGIRARVAVLSSAFSGGIAQSLDAYFDEAHGKLVRAIQVIGDVKKMMATVNRKFAEAYGISPVETAEFSTDRFLIELDRLKEQCDREYRSTQSMLTRRRSTVGSLFFDTVALKVIHIFEIADREVRAWMNAFIRPLEAQVNSFQEQANSRIEGMGRIRNAETDLLSRVDELNEFLAQCAARQAAWDVHNERIRRLLDVERDSSLSANI
jgi:Dynamin family